MPEEPIGCELDPGSAQGEQREAAHLGLFHGLTVVPTQQVEEPVDAEQRNFR